MILPLWKGLCVGLDFAIDELYATGWTALDTAGCYHSNGRAYPGVQSVKVQFREAGFDMAVQHIQLFDCYRAEWRDGSGAPAGAAVGRTEAEAAVYALAQLRRHLMAAVS